MGMRIERTRGAAEATHRDEAYRKYMKKTDMHMSTESGNRGKFRTITSTS